MEEDWKEVTGWPRYQISNYGWLFDSKMGRLWEPAVSSSGYRQIMLLGVEEKKSFYIHRLVAFEFVPGYFEGAVVNHKDGVKTNNRADNLEWVTHQQNMQHMHETGLYWGRKGRVIETLYDPGPLPPW